ncbi:hypothetical protein K7432_013363 [Basidiobolus ranarum]|uniref:Uncharacterized protein n=1 Tax=Basidiobolus ranarum TaxID=34480 RepID=A0ABR2WJE2_9FUNG
MANALDWHLDTKLRDMAAMLPNISFWNFEILRLGGSVKILTFPSTHSQPPTDNSNQDQSQQQPRKFILSTVEMTVESGNHSFELLSQPKIMVDK